MRKLMPQSASASMASFSSLCRFHVQTVSSRIPACGTHAASSNMNLVFCRRHSFTSSYNAQCADTTTLPGTHPYGNRTESRNLSSANDRNIDKLDAEGRQPERWRSYVADWSKRELLMATCFEFWDHRPDGVNVIASYIDTAASVDKLRRQQMPTALVVPSGLSDHIELKPLLDLMVKDGWRVVIPDVIGMKICIFKHA